MEPANMKYLSVQPDSDFYLWQLQVQMSNFRKFGIEQDSIIVLGYQGEINPNALAFEKTTTAKVHFIEDTRKDVKYIPSLRPHLLSKLYKESPIKESVFYHDADMIFTYSLPDFSAMSEQRVYVSDTVSYIGANYIRSKSPELLERMCHEVGIDPVTVEANQKNSGGAQYLFNVPLDSIYWEKVERDCEELYQLMNDTSGIYNPQHPIQSWTSDMWSVLWNLWLRGIDTEVNSELSFCWPTDFIEAWNRNKIFHNAGVSPTRNELFYKGAFITQSPFSIDLSSVSPSYCSFNYVAEFPGVVI